MKICHVAPWFPSSNAKTMESQQGIFNYRQIMKLSDRGHEYKVISVKWRGQTDYEVVNGNVEVYRVPHISLFRSIRYPIPNLLQLNRQIKEVCQKGSIDLIEFITVDYLTTLPFFLAKKLGIPILVHVFGIPGFFWSYGDKIVDTIAYIYNRLIGTPIFKSADGILTDNPLHHNYFSRIGINANKIYVVTKGVDTGLFKPRAADESLRFELGIKSNDAVILYVGRLDLIKGVNYLLQAAKTILSQYEYVKFIIVGDGSLRKQYEEFVGPFSGNIVFTGFREDIPALMNIADIFVLPSLSEGAANAAMEASSSGLPLIATNVGGMPEVVSDGQTGILIKPKDVGGLVKAMERLIDNRALARKMGQRGRERMEERYNWEIICDKFEKMYRDIIDSSRTSLLTVEGKRSCF